jgi:hypothetical protein
MAQFEWIGEDTKHDQKLIDILERIMIHLSTSINSVCKEAIREKNINKIIECIHYKIKNK